MTRVQGTIAHALAAAGALVLLYVTFRLTVAGSHVDETVRSTVARDGRSAKPVALDVLGLINPASLLLAVLLLSLVAWRTHGRRAAMWLALEIATVVAASQVLKAVLPKLSSRTAELTVGGGSFPSGHTTIAAALTLALVAVLPERWNAAPRVLVVPVVTVFAVATVVAGWHRPSDAVAGVLLALTAHYLWLTVSRRDRAPSRSTEGAR